MSENDHPVTVVESPDEGLIAVAQSLLDDSGTKYYVKNRHLQSMYGMAQTGLYPYAIQVDPDDAERAREILSGLGQEGPVDEPMNYEAPNTPEAQRSSPLIMGMLSSRMVRFAILFLLLILPLILLIIGTLAKSE